MKKVRAMTPQRTQETHIQNTVSDTERPCCINCIYSKPETSTATEWYFCAQGGMVSSEKAVKFYCSSYKKSISSNENNHETVVIEHLGDPIAKARPRFAGVGQDGRPHTYTPERTKHAECELTVKAMSAFTQPWTCPVKVTIRFSLPLKKSVSKSMAERMLQGIVRPTATPDIDNLVKLTFDALNGVAWVDDSQVIELHTEKVFGVPPMTHITIEKHPSLVCNPMELINRTQKVVNKTFHKLYTYGKFRKRRYFRRF